MWNKEFISSKHDSNNYKTTVGRISCTVGVELGSEWISTNKHPPDEDITNCQLFFSNFSLFLSCLFLCECLVPNRLSSKSALF